MLSESSHMQDGDIGITHADREGGAGLPAHPPDPGGTRFTAEGLRKRFRPVEFLTEKFVTVVAMTSLAAIVMIFVFVFREAVPLLVGKDSGGVAAVTGVEEEQETYGEEFLGQSNAEVSRSKTRSASKETAGAEGEATVGNLLSETWQPVSAEPKYGLLPLVVGSLKVTVIAVLLASPLAILAALFTSSFAPRWAKEVLKPAIELLAAIPSVVWGFIGYMVLGPIIIWTTGAPIGINVLNGGIILALMSVPVIVSVGEDAFKAVPDSYREAAISLGANRWEIVTRVLFPAAKNGLLAAVLLGVGRAVGETMAVLMATGHAVQIPHSLLDPVRTLTATIASELGETVRGGDHYRVLFLIGVVLFTIAFTVNLAADLVVKGVRNQQS